MPKTCKYVRKTLNLVKQMIVLADRGEVNCSDYSSAVLFGVVRDCAYKIKARAEEQRDRLRTLGDWETSNDMKSLKNKETVDEIN